jgi:hypothetical protein
MVHHEVVEILERAHAGDYERLMRLVSSLVRSDNEDKDEIVIESMLTLANKLKSGEPPIVLAGQIGGIVKIHKLRVYTRETKARDALVVGGDEQLARHASDETDPAVTVERLEQLDAVIAMFEKMKAEKPREFALLMADYQEMPPVEFFAKLRGEALTPGNAWKLRERATKTAAKGLQKIRKDSSS